MKTLAEVELCSKEMLTAEEVAPIFGADAHSIRLQAHADPKLLGFPVVVIGNRVHIPREGLLRFCKALNVKVV